MATGRFGNILVGLFVLAMLAALIVGIALLTGRSGATDQYYTIYRNVTDVRFGTPVLYEGYPIGQVEQVTPRPTDTGMEFLVELSVAQGWRIPSDSVAEVVSPRILSPVSIEIKGGVSEQALQPGETLSSRPAQNLFAAMGLLASRLSAIDFARVGPLLVTLDESLSGIRDIVLSDGQQASAQLADLLTSMNSAVPPVLEELETFSHTLNETAEDVRLMTNPDNRQRIESILASLDRSSSDVQVIARQTRGLVERMTKVVDSSAPDAEQSVEDARYVMEMLARDMGAIMQNMEATSRNVQEFSRQIRANPGLIIRGASPSDEAVRP